jgi:hypothetical protein
MLTSSFGNYTGPGRISIARRAPRKDSGYRVLRELAPGPWFNSVSPRDYVHRYDNEILRPLDPRAIHARLLELADGAEPVLLCWERAPFSLPERWWQLPPEKDHELDFSNWCHRRMVAYWLEHNLGFEVKEWVASVPSTGPRQGSIF